MADKFVGLSEEQAQKLAKGLERLNKTPRGASRGASTYKASTTNTIKGRIEDAVLFDPKSNVEDLKKQKGTVKIWMPNDPADDESAEQESPEGNYAPIDAWAMGLTIGTSIPKQADVTASYINGRWYITKVHGMLAELDESNLTDSDSWARSRYGWKEVRWTTGEFDNPPELYHDPDQCRSATWESDDYARPIITSPYCVKGDIVWLQYGNSYTQPEGEGEDEEQVRKTNFWFAYPGLYQDQVRFCTNSQTQDIPGAGTEGIVSPDYPFSGGGPGIEVPLIVPSFDPGTTNGPEFVTWEAYAPARKARVFNPWAVPIPKWGDGGTLVLMKIVWSYNCWLITGWSC